MELPIEILNHIFKYCQGRTNKIMKEHINTVKVYKEPYCDETNLIHILHLMENYGHTYFEKNKFHSRFYRCINCNRIGSRDPYIVFGELFCSEVCADMFDY